MNNSSLYKDEGIVFNQDWVTNYNEQISQHDIDDSECDQQSVNDEETSNNIDTKKLDDEDEWSEDEIEIPAGVPDTLLTATDFLDDNERQHILNVTPAKGNRPLSIFRDTYSEEFAYPGIFIGQKRPEIKDHITKEHYSDICKSELRRSDIRSAMCAENFFYKTKKLQMKILLSVTSSTQKMQGK